MSDILRDNDEIRRNRDQCQCLRGQNDIGVPACASPSDYYWGAGWELVHYSARIGDNHLPGDTLRYWIESLYTSDPRILEMPPIYLDSRIKKGLTTYAVDRRDCSQDDHGETYPAQMDGPDIYQTLTVPPGLYVLSLYFFNRQSAGCIDRDYRLSVRQHPANKPLEDIAGFHDRSELAHERVAQYFAGVWKRFQVRGPQTLTVQVNRNNSWNTELDGVMLDLVDEDAPPYFQTVDQWKAKQAHQETMRQALIAHPVRFHASPSDAEAANSLFHALAQVQVTNSAWYAVHSRRFYGPLLRWYLAQSQQASAKGNSRLQQSLATCYYQMAMYPQWEDRQRQTGLTSGRDVEKALRWDGVSPDLRGQGNAMVTTFMQKRHRSASLSEKQAAGLSFGK